MASKQNTMSSKITDTAKQEVDRVRHVAEEGAKSGAYLYPLKVSCLINSITRLTR